MHALQKDAAAVLSMRSFALPLIMADIKRHCGEREWLCPHCQQSLAYRTYQKHKKLYYRPQEKCWIKTVEGTDITSFS